MALKVGELFALLRADDSQFDKTLRNAETKFRNTGKSLSSIGKGLTLGATAPILGFGASALSAAKDFEQGMSKVKAVSGATADEMKKLHDLALKLGKDTSFSANEAAAGLEELLKAGVSVEDIFNGAAQAALDLAAAGDIGLDEAASIMSNALNAFSNDTVTAAQAADYLAGAANASASSVQDMKYGLAASAAVANAMGMDFKDTSTALAVFAQNGLLGSDAGTSLKTMLMNLQPTTKKQVELFRELNLLSEDGQSLFYDEKGEMKSLSEVAGLLNNRMKDMTKAQRALALEQMFGSDAIRGASILFDQGSEGVEKMFEAMSKVTAADVAKTKLDNLSGSLEQASGSLDTLKIKMMESKTGPVRELVDGFTGLINKLLEMDDAQLGHIITIGGVVAAIGPLLWVTGGLIGSFATIIEKLPIITGLFKGAGTGATIASTGVGGFTGAIGGMLATTGGVIALGIAFAALYGWIAKVEAKWDTARAIADQKDGLLEGYDYRSTSSAMDRINGTDTGVRTSREDALKNRSTTEKKNTLKEKVLGLATGGIVNGPTLAMIGEGIESEAVAPLSKLNAMIQKAVISSQGMQPAAMSHSGTIRVEGVNDRQQLVAVTEFVMEKMRREVRR